MGRKQTEIPFCKHSGLRDCFACGIDCKCYLLSDTDWIKDGEKCSFYKSRYEVAYAEDKRRNRVQRAS